ncbi:50S ribosomal protein L6 [Verrucomicrobiaceae bacterium 5K15]|uniref:Large ribosomal subunit protein uL6 n=1 Tax=Oceaniferula flava TaxID=2800421 RepID=A0AAE2VCX5_9BACT|nr:50S ribosomal protein L6 [Oceaniferula flavus]MBK1856140.1 50S ribosomal protein L6 [Oceaniferula flavus]MBM1137447.1 50S ribosomal protein L6 [Oceaniferula flavus]
MSRIGLKTISLPEKVSIKSDNAGTVTVEGPKGKLEWTMPKGITLEEESGTVTVKRNSEHRVVRALHGTSRSLISNMIEGVSNGFVKQLEIQGVGFRAAVKGKDLDLSLGKSHPILHPIPEGLTVTVDQNTNIKVEGIDKQLVGQFAAEVRRYYPPEPFKGKGVRYVGERVRRKAGKSVQ